MPLESGKTLGHYEILSPLGAGGMGEVYKARDPRLNRTVAIKVLPQHIVDRPELKQRFEREAQTIAALNHPHICIVHDVGQDDGVDFLVMEYIDGETLADRIARGPIPFDPLLTYAAQITDALDRAHRQDVTHRDLKPGNIMITKSGVKLLDFGLAKYQQPVVAASNSAFSALTTASPGNEPLTAEGTILGTLQYMAPEQLEGKEADARSDIFALGATLYEMATGRRAFQGRSQVSLMAAIMEHDPPPVSTLQPLTPPVFDELIRICLAKNPDERWQSAKDLLHEFKLLRAHWGITNTAATRAPKREIAAWAVAAMFLVLAVSVVFWFKRGAEERLQSTFEVSLPTASALPQLQISLSPDGKYFAASIPDLPGGRALWIRPLGRLDPMFPKGTNGALDPFWSPDSRFVGFFAGGKLKKMDVSGSPPQTLADANGGGGTWNGENVLVFGSTYNGPLFRVSASGGAVTQVTELDQSRGETAHRHPFFLPDGIHFLYLAANRKAEESAIYVGSINSRDKTRLVTSNVKAQFAPPNYLLFMREDTLMGQVFDPSTLELSGEPVAVAEEVGTNLDNGAAGFAVSGNGVLALRKGASADVRQLLWVDRNGKSEGLIGTPARYQNPVLSPDGKQLAVSKNDSQAGGDHDIWITDLERGINSRFTFAEGRNNNPVWSPDGKQIAFSSSRDGGAMNLYRKSSGGTGQDELLLKNANNKWTDDWSGDGRYLLYTEIDPKTSGNLWVLPLEGKSKPISFRATPFNERSGSFSPDGRWIAYQSDETGRTEIYVQSFPDGVRKWKISTNGGISVRWRPDGRELLYVNRGELMSVDLTGTVPGVDLKAGVPRVLFSGVVGDARNFAPAAGGNRFLVMSNPAVPPGAQDVVFVLNWTSGRFAR